MEGPTGAQEGYFLSRGRLYCEVIFDLQILRLGFGLLIRRDLGRLTAAIGPLRLVIGVLLITTV